MAAGGGRTTIIVSAALREVVAASTGLPALPQGKVYELWLIGAARIRPAGLVAGAGPVLASGLAPGDELGMTVEPAGGSPRPTTRPILLVRID